jgi:putative ABC transport system permease protein
MRIQPFLTAVILALRRLRRAPAFLLAVTLTLGLVLGTATAIVAVADDVLRRPLPFPGAANIVVLGDAGRGTARIPGAAIAGLSERQTFAAVAYYFGGQVGVQLSGRAAFAGTYWVPSDFFRVFPVKPAAGRLPAEGARREAIVGYGFAGREFGTSDAAIGRTLAVDGDEFLIVGVSPEGFAYPREADLWVSAPRAPASSTRLYAAVARLEDGTSLGQARAAVARAMQSSLAEASLRISVTGLREYLVGDARPVLTLWVAAGLVALLLALVNVAGLSVIRGVGLAGEFEIRRALGATRSSLLAQVAGEGAVVGTLTAVVAMGAHVLTHAWLVASVPPTIARFAAGQPGSLPLALVAAGGIVAAAVVTFALVGHAWRPGGQAGSPRIVPGLYRWLLPLQLSLAFALVAASALLGRSLVTLRAVDLGYDQRDRLVMYVHVPARTQAELGAATRFATALPERLRLRPDVVDAAAVMGLPGGRYSLPGRYVVGQARADAETAVDTNLTLAGPGYFRTMGIPVRHGRDFTELDRRAAPRVGIISESIARQAFGERDPLGHSLTTSLEPVPVTIVGVVSDVRRGSPAMPVDRIVYLPLAQYPSLANEVQVVIQARGPAGPMAKEIGDMFEREAPAVATSFTSVDALVAGMVEPARFRTLLLAGLAAVATGLSGIGIFVVVAFASVARRREVGIRLALGARRQQIVALILRSTLRSTAVGLTGGILIMAVASPWLSHLLFGVTAFDLPALGGAAASLTVVALAAALLPSWRVSRLDPARVLLDA